VFYGEEPVHAGADRESPLGGRGPAVEEFNVNQAGRLRELEGENARLKKLLAEQGLDIAILREASRGNSRRRRVVAGPSRWCAGGSL
jgi:hypothetical protein